MKNNMACGTCGGGKAVTVVRGASKVLRISNTRAKFTKPKVRISFIKKKR